MKKLLLTLLFLAEFAWTGFAMDVKRYLEGRKDRTKEPAVQLYVNGVGEGYSWANVALSSAQQRRLFCVPPKLAMRAQNYEDMIDKKITEARQKMTASELEATPVELLLLHALIETFPCGPSDEAPAAHF